MISILLLEDSDRDAEMEIRMLSKSGIDANVERVQTRDTFAFALQRPHDLILADYKLPSFDGIEALSMVRQRGITIPFIFVSGSIGEERAVEALRSGATDYVLKDRITRLPAAVERAVREYRERQERVALEKRLERSNRVESLGRVAATMAHEFNNVLMSVMQVDGMLRRFFPDDDRCTRLAGQLSNAVSRGRRITSEVLRFSNPAEPTAQTFDVCGWLSRHVQELEALVSSRHVRLHVHNPGIVVLVRVDQEQLQQALVNLVTNACDAMPAGGDLTIVLAVVDDRMLLRVSDTGTGMTAETLAKIFEPLFTTKRQGTGLGLAVVHQVVTAGGGAIDVDSRVGIGTTFTINLPQARLDPTAARAKGLSGSC